MQLSPIFNLPAFTDAEGLPLAGAKIFQYEAGSFSVLKETYTSEDGGVPNANPIVLDSAGRLPAGVALWLTPGELYNLVLTEPDGTTVLQSFDDVSGVVVFAAGDAPVLSPWVEIPGAATYIAPTQFLVVGNYATEMAIGNRVRLTLNTGYLYGTVTAVTYSDPNTQATIYADGATLDASLTIAEYSVLPANKETVDAGGVSFTELLPYSTNGTVGYKIRDMEAEIAAVESKRARNQLVYVTSGTGDAYEITPSPEIDDYADEAHWVVKFTGSSSGACTLNVNDLGADPLKQYDSGGNLVDAVVVDGMVSEVAYDDAENVFVLLDPLLPASVASPRGYQAFTSNDNFTVPAGVYYVKVTCVGGGGGGGAGYTYSPHFDESYPYYGGTGGAGAAAFNYVAVTPDDVHAVAVGAAGTGSTGSNNATAGGTTSFGVTLASASGGAPGTDASYAGDGGAGAAGSSGTGFVTIGGAVAWPNYGKGGLGKLGTPPGYAGTAGVCIVEW